MIPQMKHLEGLNDPQKEAVTTIEGPLLVVAGAGAGKTRVITHRIAEIISRGTEPHQILAVTFTNKAAREMRERVLALLSNNIAPDNPPFVSTFHALGVYLLRRHHKELDIPMHFTIFDRDDSKRAVRQAMKKRDLNPKDYDPGKILATISRQKGQAVSSEEFIPANYWEELVSEVWLAYEKILQESKAYDFDDLLLKTLLFLRKSKEAREKYQDLWKYIHVDEYQDTNKVQYELVKILSEKHKNVCVVGDVDQCLPEGTKILVPGNKNIPIEKIQKGDEVISCYGSGDFRPAKVIGVHNKRHLGDLVRLKTKTGEVLTSTPEHIHFAGYRLAFSPGYYFTYLMCKGGVGWRLGVSQMYTNARKQTVPGFIQRCTQEHADQIWIIGVHNKPVAARVQEYLTSIEYKIPTIPFVARRGSSQNGYVHDQKTLWKIFESLDTQSGAKRLLDNLGLSIDYPHHQAQGHTGSRQNINITLCADRRGKTPMHLLSITASDTKTKKLLAAAGFSVRKSKTGSRSWRCVFLNSSYKKILEKAKLLEDLLPGAQIVKLARFGKNQGIFRGKCSLPFLPAASVLPGMVIFNSKGQPKIVKSVEKIRNQHSQVYDLDVEKTHNYIANGIVTHNSIYSWRGARVSNILDFEKDFPGAKTILLEENYRSTKNILGVANDVIRKNESRIEKNLFTQNHEGEKLELLEGWNETNEAEKVVTKIKELLKNKTSPKEIAILYRANFQSRVLEEALLRETVPYQLVGTKFFERKEVKDTLSYIRASLNPESVPDISRVINIPARGIGKITLAKVLTGKSSELSGKARESVNSFYQTLQKIKECALKNPPSELVRYVLKTSGLEESYKKLGDEGLERIENVRELASLASRYNGLPVEEGIANLLTDAALATDQDNVSNDDSIKLMTVHASKGLEFDYVFIVGLEEGLFPHERLDNEKVDTEEERRLFYVAITRARKKVFLSYASMRTVFGSANLRAPSSFLEDIDRNFLKVEDVIEQDIDIQRKRGIDAIFDIDF